MPVTHRRQAVTSARLNCRRPPKKTGVPGRHPHAVQLSFGFLARQDAPTFRNIPRVRRDSVPPNPTQPLHHARGDQSTLTEPNVQRSPLPPPPPVVTRTPLPPTPQQRAWGTGAERPPPRPASPSVIPCARPLRPRFRHCFRAPGQGVGKRGSQAEGGFGVRYFSFFQKRSFTGGAWSFPNPRKGHLRELVIFGLFFQGESTGLWRWAKRSFTGLCLSSSPVRRVVCERQGDTGSGRPFELLSA